MSRLKHAAQAVLTHRYQMGAPMLPIHNELETAVRESEEGWVKTSDRKPDASRLIVKRWKNGSVWAGVYSGTDKDSSFDEWCYLP